MIQRSVDRSRSTRGGLATSVALHAALLLLLATYVGRQAAKMAGYDELTEIAYIEAHYGEDVAARVKMKQLPARSPFDDPGRGVSTDSAMKPKNPSPDPPRPKKKGVEDVAAPEIAPASQPKALAEANALENKSFQRNDAMIVDSSKLSSRSAADGGNAPTLQSKTPTSTFRPSDTGLTSRSNKLIIGDADDVARSRSSNSGAVADVEGPTSLKGGGLGGAKGGGYSAPSSGLSPKSSGSGQGGKAVLDVDGPSGSGGSGSGSGRKTILDYGSGSGRGGGLSGRRTKLVEAPSTDNIVKKDSGASAGKSQVAEVKMDGKGVSMTISGEIKGRKILSSVPPVYTEKAKKNGWEGVVAVHFTVLADGRVKDNVYFDQSSVHRDLNRAALDAIKKWRFAPLGSQHASVEQWGVITIVFRLH